MAASWWDVRPAALFSHLGVLLVLFRLARCGSVAPPPLAAPSYPSRCFSCPLPDWRDPGRGAASATAGSCPSRRSSCPLRTGAVAAVVAPSPRWRDFAKLNVLVGLLDALRLRRVASIDDSASTARAWPLPAAHLAMASRDLAARDCACRSGGCTIESKKPIASSAVTITGLLMRILPSGRRVR